MMSGQDELERYEQTEVQELIRLLEMSRPQGELRAPADFRLKVLSRIERTPSRRGALSWLQVAFVPTWAPALTAALLVLSLGTNVWLGTRVLETSKPAVNRLASEVGTLKEPMGVHVFQRGLRPGVDLGALIAAQETELESTSYGFAGEASGSKAFRLGTLYAEALALARSGDIEAASQRWHMMEQAMGQPAEPMLTYLRDVQKSLQQEPPASERFQALLPLFESFHEASAVREHDQALLLFQAGAWMTNMRLAAAVGDVEGLHRGRVVDYFLSRLEGPKGVEERLQQLDDLLAKKTLSEQELKAVDKLVVKVQQILS